MTLREGLLAGSIALSTATGAIADTKAETAEQIGDILQLALPASAALCAYSKGNNALEEYTLDVIKGQAIVSGSKIALGDHPMNKRPNGSSAGGFPSGHTYAATTGASYLSNNCIDHPVIKYSPYVAAAFTAWSRVISDNHSAEQVIVGYLLGIFMQIDDEKKSISPGTWVNYNGDLSTGIKFTYTFTPAKKKLHYLILQTNKS